MGDSPLIQNWPVSSGLIAAVSVIALFVRRVLPKGFGGAVFVFGVSSAVAIIFIALRAAGAMDLRLLAHLAAALCVVWSAVGIFTLRPTHKEEETRGFAASALAGALVFGVLAAVIVVYGLTFVVLYRLFAPQAPIVFDARAGTLDLALLLLAVGLWAQRTRESHQPAILLLLVALLATSAAMLVRPAAGSLGADATGRSTPVGWWQWLALLSGSYGLIVLAAYVLCERYHRRRQIAAWPDRLANLVMSPPRWEGFFEAVAVIATGVLLLGTYAIVRGGPPGIGLGIVLMAAAAAAGAGCLALCQRVWNANLFGLGAALMTLTAATLCTLLVPDRPGASAAVRLPIVHNAALFGLVFMTFLWFWLSRFWRQQLLDGQPWTAAGRAIPYARRSGFLVAALTALISYQIALWPMLPSVVAPDAATHRWVLGLSAIGLLSLVLAWDARHSRSTAVAALCIASVGAAIAFAFARWPDPVLRGRLIQYFPIVAAATALPLLAIAEMLPSTERWRCFAPPLWIVALLLLPAWSLLTLVAAPRQPAAWLTPMSLAAVGGVYALAGSREGRRAFLALSVVLLLAAAFNLSRLYAAAGARL